jgi:hypothetical protein
VYGDLLPFVSEKNIAPLTNWLFPIHENCFVDLYHPVQSCEMTHHLVDGDAEGDSARQREAIVRTPLKSLSLSKLYNS